MSALNKKSFLTYLKEGGIYVVLLVLLAIIIFQDPTFLSLLNLSNILTQSRAFDGQAFTQAAQPIHCCGVCSGLPRKFLSTGIGSSG